APFGATLFITYQKSILLVYLNNDKDVFVVFLHLVALPGNALHFLTAGMDIVYRLVDLLHFLDVKIPLGFQFLQFVIITILGQEVATVKNQHIVSICYRSIAVLVTDNRQ